LFYASELGMISMRLYKDRKLVSATLRGIQPMEELCSPFKCVYIQMTIQDVLYNVLLCFKAQYTFKTHIFTHNSL
jgi:hypothetical protein